MHTQVQKTVNAAILMNKFPNTQNNNNNNSNNNNNNNNNDNNNNNNTNNNNNNNNKNNKNDNKQKTTQKWQHTQGNFFFKQMGTEENIHLKVMKTISSPEFHI